MLTYRSWCPIGLFIILLTWGVFCFDAIPRCFAEGECDPNVPVEEPQPEVTQTEAAISEAVAEVVAEATYDLSGTDGIGADLGITTELDLSGLTVDPGSFALPDAEAGGGTPEAAITVYDASGAITAPDAVPGSADQTVSPDAPGGIGVSDQLPLTIDISAAAALALTAGENPSFPMTDLSSDQREPSATDQTGAATDPLSAFLALPPEQQQRLIVSDQTPAGVWDALWCALISPEPGPTGTAGTGGATNPTIPFQVGITTTGGDQISVGFGGATVSGLGLNRTGTTPPGGPQGGAPDPNTTVPVELVGLSLTGTTPHFGPYGVPPDPNIPQGGIDYEDPDINEELGTRDSLPPAEPTGPPGDPNSVVYSGTGNAGMWFSIPGNSPGQTPADPNNPVTVTPTNGNTPNDPNGIPLQVGITTTGSDRISVGWGGVSVAPGPYPGRTNPNDPNSPLVDPNAPPVVTTEVPHTGQGGLSDVNLPIRDADLGAEAAEVGSRAAAEAAARTVLENANQNPQAVIPLLSDPPLGSGNTNPNQNAPSPAGNSRPVPVVMVEVPATTPPGYDPDARRDGNPRVTYGDEVPATGPSGYDPRAARDGNPRVTYGDDVPATGPSGPRPERGERWFPPSGGESENSVGTGSDNQATAIYTEFETPSGVALAPPPGAAVLARLAAFTPGSPVPYSDGATGVGTDLDRDGRCDRVLVANPDGSREMLSRQAVANGRSVVERSLEVFPGGGANPITITERTVYAPSGNAIGRETISSLGFSERQMLVDTDGDGRPDRRVITTYRPGNTSPTTRTVDSAQLATSDLPTRHL